MKNPFGEPKELDIREILSIHDKTQRILMKANCESGRNLTKAMIQGDRDTAASIELLYFPTRDNSPDQCQDCNSWTFDGRCGCDAQQQATLDQQLAGSIQWAHDRGVE